MTAKIESTTHLGHDLGTSNHETLKPILYAFFRRRITDQQEIDDLVQEVFLRLVRHGAFREGENPEAYAYRTAQSVLLDRARYKRSHYSDRHVEFDPDIHAGAEGHAEEALLARDALRHAGLALARLPERTRHVFLLRRVDGLSMNEIAGQLGISLSSAEKHLKRAALHLIASRKRSQ